MSRTYGVLAAWLMGTAVCCFGFAVPAVASAPPPIACGSTITKSDTLHTDLTCSGTALTILGPAGKTVSLNLGGHSISGGSVEVAGGGAAISNGTIRDVSGTTDAIDVHYGRLTLSHVVVSGSSTGLFIGGDAPLVIRNSRFDQNNVGVETNETSGYLIANSSFTRNNLAADLFLANGTFIGNYVARNATGIQASDVFGAQVFRNNLFVQNTGEGLRYGDGGVTQSVAEITSNEFVGNGTGFVWDTASRSPGPVSGTVQLNVFSKNRGDGANLLVAPGSAVTVAHNTAMMNGGYGIEAVNVIDGGKNVAALNGNPAECLGVTCAAHP